MFVAASHYLIVESPHIVSMWNPLTLSQCGIPLTFSQCGKAIRFLVGEVALTLSQCGKALGFL